MHLGRRRNTRQKRTYWRASKRLDGIKGYLRGWGEEMASWRISEKWGALTGMWLVWRCVSCVGKLGMGEAQRPISQVQFRLISMSMEFESPMSKNPEWAGKQRRRLRTSSAPILALTCVLQLKRHLPPKEGQSRTARVRLFERGKSGEEPLHHPRHRPQVLWRK